MPEPTRQDREPTPDKKAARPLARKEEPAAARRDVGSLKDGGAGLASDPPSERHRLLLIQLSAPGRSAEKADFLRTLQRSHGNQYVQRLVGSVAPDVGIAKAGAGQPLDKPVRDQMERSFGESFANVRVHTDRAAGDAARGIGACAFATGQDVFFAEGTFRPETPQGKGLLAHELAHTIQQRGTRPGTQAVSEIVAPNDPLEQQAERASADVMRGARPGPISTLSRSPFLRSAAPIIQRQPAGKTPPPPTPTGADGSGYFVIGLGNLKIKQEEIEAAKSKGKYTKDLSAMSLPGLNLKNLTLDLNRSTGEIKQGRVATQPAIPFVKFPGKAGPVIEIDKDGKASLDVKAHLDIPALNNPKLDVTLKQGEISAEVTLAADKLKPAGIPKLKMPQASVTVGIAGGKLYGSGQVGLEYEGLATGDFSVSFKDGAPSAKGAVDLTPDYLKGTKATLAIDEQGKLRGDLTVPAAKLSPPIPGLKITDGTVSLGMENGKLSGKGENVTFSYKSLGDGVLNFLIKQDHLEGSGSLNLSVPGLQPIKGDIRYAGGRLSGKATITADKFPKALPVKSGTIVVALGEKGDVSGRGAVVIDLFGVGRGELKFGYEKGVTDLSAEVLLQKIPGLESGRIFVGLKGDKFEGEGEIGIAPKQIPGLTGNLLVAYKDNRFSGKTKIGYARDKFGGWVVVLLVQDEKGKMAISGSGELTARLTDWLTGTVHIDVLPDATTKIAGQLKAADVELFPEKKADRELFSISRNIPLWAILVAVIRLRGGVRAGVGPGRLRGITAEGEFSTAPGAEPSFSITGELFIPAYAEAYVAFGAGLGLDVLIGSLTGGIEAVGTAGIYGAVSVIPVIEYANGNFSITGTATMAAGAKLKLGLQAWAEVEAFWITVWENTWQLAEWVWDVGPELAMQAQMKYVFGRPEPPTFDFKTSDIDASRLIQDAMPKDGPKGSGARDALKNRAEWKGKLKEARQDASKLPPALAEKSAKAPVPKALPPKPAKKAPPADLKSKDPAKVKDKALKELKDKGGPTKSKALDKAHQERFDKGMAALDRLAEAAKDDPEDSKEIAEHLAGIKRTYGFTSLTHTKDGDDWLVEAEMSPKKTKKVNAKPPAPLPSKVTWGAPDPWRGGKWMKANPLSKDIYLNGSDVPAGGVNPIFQQKVGPQKLKRDNTRLYIEGHLLNNKLGGPGDEPKNLTPLSYKANIAHWRASEGDLQDLMRTGQDPMAYYEVQVNYPASKRKTTPPVIPAEGELAKSITVKWQRMKRKKGKAVKDDKSSLITKTVDNVPPYPHE
jgi:hypothetical protein